MSVAEEKHDSAGIIEFVHGVEVGHLRDVNEVYSCKLAHLLCHLVESLIDLHAGGVPVMTETDDHHSFFFS